MSPDLHSLSARFNVNPSHETFLRQTIVALCRTHGQVRETPTPGRRSSPLHQTLREGKAIIAAGAGTGISAKFIEQGVT